VGLAGELQATARRVADTEPCDEMRSFEQAGPYAKWLATDRTLGAPPARGQHPVPEVSGAGLAGLAGGLAGTARCITGLVSVLLIWEAGARQARQGPARLAEVLRSDRTHDRSGNGATTFSPPYILHALVLALRRMLRRHVEMKLAARLTREEGPADI
jgi:hypothetical protein